jgi:hypothetical protein
LSPQWSLGQSKQQTKQQQQLLLQLLLWNGLLLFRYTWYV